MGKKLNPGDSSISAREWNRHVDASDFIHSRYLQGNGQPRPHERTDVSFVTVSNGSGADRRQGELLEFTGIISGLTDLTDRQIMLAGGSPTLANGFGILQEPVASGDSTPKCQVSGACVALVNVTSTSHRYATVASATYVLQSGDSGPVRILCNPAAATGEQTCAILIGGGQSVEIHRGVTNATNTKGSTTGTVSRYTDGTNSDSSIDDTVTNDWADIASGKKVIYVKLGSIYYIVNSEKTSLTVLEDMRIKSGDTAIEAEGQTVFVDTAATAAWSDKITLTSCP